MNSKMFSGGATRHVGRSKNSRPSTYQKDKLFTKRRHPISKSSPTGLPDTSRIPWLGKIGTEDTESWVVLT